MAMTLMGPTSATAERVPVDQQLLDLIKRSVGSVWALELLLVLRATDRAWSEAELVTELRSSQLVVSQSLAGLVAGGLVESSDKGVRYRPADPETAKLVDKLADTYRNRPDAVRRAIVAPSDDKLKSFSDAFFWRKRQDE